MKVKLHQSGFESYTGQMGVVQFENGVSTDHVSPFDALRVAGAMQARWEDGSEINLAATSITKNDLSADSAAESTRIEAHAESYAQAPETPANASSSVGVEGEGKAVEYTAEQFDAIASEGIAAVREIADKYGIKGRSIADIHAALVRQGVVASE